MSDPELDERPRGLTPTLLVVIPVVFALALLIAIQLASVGLEGGDYQLLTKSANTLTRQMLIPHSLFLLAGFAVVAYLRLWREAGFVAPLPGITSRRWTFAPPAIGLLGVAIGFAGAVDERPTGYLVVLFVATMAIGFNEETWFRGIVLAGYRRTMGDGPAIAVTAALFGLGHLINAALGLSVADVITQVIVTTATGVVFGLIRVRTGSIYPAIATHGLYNAALLSIAPAEEFGTFILGRLLAAILIGVASCALARRQPAK
jgi:hypothetical protein